jgi:hypothetical protein
MHGNTITLPWTHNYKLLIVLIVVSIEGLLIHNVEFPALYSHAKLSGSLYFLSLLNYIRALDLQLSNYNITKLESSKMIKRTHHLRAATPQRDTTHSFFKGCKVQGCNVRILKII